MHTVQQMFFLQKQFKSPSKEHPWYWAWCLERKPICLTWKKRSRIWRWGVWQKCLTWVWSMLCWWAPFPRQSGGLYGAEPAFKCLSGKSGEETDSQSESDDSEFSYRCDDDVPGMVNDFCRLDIWHEISDRCGDETGKKSKFVLKRILNFVLISRALRHDNFYHTI